MVEERKHFSVAGSVIAAMFFAPVFYVGAYGGFLRGLLTGLIVLGAAFAAFVVCCCRRFLPASSKPCSRFEPNLRPVRRAAFVAPLAVCGALFALTRLFFMTAPLKTLIPENRIISLYGTALSSPVKTSGENYLLTFKVQTAFSQNMRASASGRVNLLLKSAAVEALYPGKLYSAHSTAGSAAPFIEKGASFTVAGRFLEKSGLFFAETAGQTAFSSKLDLQRANFRLHLKRVLYVWGSAGGFLLALLAGSREYLDAELAAAFKNAGLAHILALSGMHLSLFGGLSAAAARFIGGKRLALAASLVCMCLFVWFAGASPSLLRALLCALLLGTASWCGLKSSVLSALCASFFIQTLIFPTDALQLSFMLSYAALFGIITAGRAITALIPLSGRFSSPFAASCGAQLCTAPISAAFFSCLTPAGIPASVAVSPIASLFLAVGLVCLLLSLAFPVLLEPFALVMRLLYACVRFPVLLFAKIPPLLL